MKILRLSAMALSVWMSLAIAGRCEDANTQPELKTASGSEVQYYRALPKGWSPQKTWPIVVTIDGSGHKFQANCEAFVRVRGDRPFIIVTPCVSSNGRDPADAKAVLEIVKQVQQASSGQPKFFITGFSAGGHVTWQFVFNQPELLAGAAPAAANFRFRGIEEVSKAPERVMLPVHGFNGEKDLPVINQQWDDAEKFAREKGYENLVHTLVSGAGHSPFAGEVLDFFATVLATKAQPAK